MTAKSSPPPRFRARLFSPTLSRWAISAALLLSAGAASATTLNVSLTPTTGEYATIQDAINAAVSGD